MKEAMKERRVGVWIIGALGSIATTVMVGALMLQKGKTAPVGMVTATEPFRELNLLPMEALTFGGCDIRKGRLEEAARHLLTETRIVDAACIEELAPRLSAMNDDVEMGTAVNCGEAICGMADTADGEGLSLAEQIRVVRRQLRNFREKHRLDRVIVVNLASTEPHLPIESYHQDLPAFRDEIEKNNHRAVRAGTLYAYAAVSEGCPYINFTPSNGALVDAVIQLAVERKVPVMGNDGKTGETLVKSALAPMFTCRNLDVLSWSGFNILGNMDGSVLSHPDNREAKIRTKDQVLGHILGYSPHSNVSIHYVPSLDDQKTAWDFIHFEGFLGARMSLQFIWQGYDSLLAAPLVLDLVRLADLAAERGEGGLMLHLASYFKAPLGVDEHRLYRQYELLTAYARAAARDVSVDVPVAGNQKSMSLPCVRKKEMKLSFSTNAFVRFSLVEAVKHIALLGFDGVEIVADVPHFYAENVSHKNLKALRGLLGSLGIRAANVNANTAVGYYGQEFWEPLFEPSLSHPEEMLRQWRVAYTKKCIEIAAELRAPSISITSGRMVPGILPERSLDLLKTSLHEILPYARRHKVRVGIEYEPGLLIERYEELAALLQEMESPGLGANLDLGHSHVLGEDPETVISGLGEKIFHVHLEDIKSRKHYHLIPGFGDMDFGNLYRCLKNVGYAGFVTVELYTYPHEPVDAAHRSLSYLQEVFVS